MPEPEVEFHPETYSTLFEPVLKDFPSLLEDLKADFLRYVSEGVRPAYFGRDVIYLWPAEAEKAKLMHIHLALPPATFPKNRPQMDLVCRKGNPSQDAALVYVQGLWDDHNYCLLAVLHPDAHGQARDKQTMKYLARLAQRFRDEH